MTIQKVMVIGAGQMGSGIAQVCAQAGFDVKLNDMKQEFFERGLGVITKNLSRDLEKGRKTEEEKQAILSRITMSLKLQDAADVDIVIEAAVENMEIKQSIFKQLDEIAPKHAILATNTSSLPITEIGAVTKRPQQVIGMHFMNPVPVMKLVEIIRGLATSDEVYKAVEEMTRKLDKTPVEVNDFPGFVSNRILTLADFIGLDTCLYIMEILHEGLGDSKYRPCPLLRKYVAAGWLGKKSGRGFYVYE